jgi:hypothetical protein
MTESGSARLRLAVWFAGATLLVVFPLVRFFDRPLREQLRLPLTPIDRVDAARARQWTFLEESRRYLPPKSSFTVLAEDPGAEMALYMMSYRTACRSRPATTAFRPPSTRAKHVSSSPSGSRTPRIPRPAWSRASPAERSMRGRE